MKSDKVNMKNAEHFAAYTNQILNGITSIYMGMDDVVINADDTENFPRITRTLEVHKIVLSYNEDGICRLQFFQKRCRR